MFDNYRERRRHDQGGIPGEHHDVARENVVTGAPPSMTSIDAQATPRLPERTEPNPSAAEAYGTNGSPPSPALAVEDVRVSFGGILALGGVSIAVEPGELCGLIGPNGAGKTTLFDTICGLRRPQTGRMLLAGDDITTTSTVQRARRGLRRTYQTVQVFGWLSVLDNVVAALDWKGGGGGLVADLVAAPGRRRRERERREQAREVLERCGLSAVADAPAGSLPIGLARMVELARATVDPPVALLLDEPASGLDATEARRLAERIDQVRQESGAGVLLVEHDMAFTMRHCDRVVVLNLGEVIAAGTPDEVRADERVRDAYLGADTAAADADSA
jgi:branched-chain amino acid transport system ATP-binding protein